MWSYIYSAYREKNLGVMVLIGLQNTIWVYNKGVLTQYDGNRVDKEN